MYIRGLIPRNIAELAEAVLIDNIWQQFDKFPIMHSVKQQLIHHLTVSLMGDIELVRLYCPASQEWQWRHVLFTKLPGTYNR